MYFNLLLLSLWTCSASCSSMAGTIDLEAKSAGPKLVDPMETTVVQIVEKESIADGLRRTGVTTAPKGGQGGLTTVMQLLYCELV